MMQVIERISPLEEIIHQTIDDYGPITYREFMELALYHPRYGYYTGEHSPFIRDIRYRGSFRDFYTAPCVHEAFGRVLARSLCRLWKELTPAPFNVVELGAGGGQLACDILTSLSREFPEVYAQTTYYVVERSSASLAEAKKILGNFPRVHYFHSLNGLPHLTGVILSNEFFDALPVHCVERTDRGLKEIYVTTRGHDLVESPGPLSDPSLKRILERLGMGLEEGQRVEVNKEATSVLKTVAQHLERGFLLTVDYGGLTSELTRSLDGTLRTLDRHRVGTNVLESPGQHDITSSVNFSFLMEEGVRWGLEKLSYTTQGKFLISAGIIDYLPQGTDTASWQERKLITKLFHPNGMGDHFKVLLQRKMQ